MKIHRFLPALTIVLVLTLVACASTSGVSHDTRRFWEHQVAARDLEPSTVIYPFEVTPEMRTWVDSNLDMANSIVPLLKLYHLQQALFDPKQFTFDYEEHLTLTADDAFARRRGNCMAFTALFVALSRAMGVPTFFVSVQRAPEVARQDSLVVINRHVVAGYFEAGQLYTFDFYTAEESPFIKHRLVPDLSASAMFHNNFGGKAIRDGNLALAVHHLEVATRLDARLSAAWVNLGVVRFRSGDPVGALEAYQNALDAEPTLSSALTNMAYVFRSLGDEERAQKALEAAAESRPSPFTLIALAEAEASRGDMETARRHLARARRAFRDEPEVFDALARLARREGNESQALRWERRAEKLRRRAESLDSEAPAAPAAPQRGLSSPDAAVRIGRLEAFTG